VLRILILVAVRWCLRRRPRKRQRKPEKVHELSGDGANMKELPGDSPEMSELSAERRVAELAANGRGETK